MPPKSKKDQPSYGSNVPFWEWADAKHSEPLEEWRSTPEQRGWPKGTTTIVKHVNWEFNVQREGKFDLTAAEQAAVTERITRGRDENALVPRSFSHELSTALHLPHKDEESTVDHYQNTMVFESKELEDKVSKGRRWRKP